MARWRGSIRTDKLGLFLAETLRIAIETRVMPPQSCGRVTVDTTGADQVVCLSFRWPPADARHQMVEPACLKARAQVAPIVPARQARG